MTRVIGQGAVKPAPVQNYTVPVGEMWYKRINLTEPGADYIYLIKEDQNYNRVIKLTRGEAGNGTCYKQAPGCEKYYGLRHIRENVVEISVRLLSKSVQGVYALYYYCKWTAHNCNRDGPIMKFLLIIEDEQTTPQSGKENTTPSSPPLGVVTGSAIQQSALLAKLTSLLMVVVPYWGF